MGRFRSPLRKGKRSQGRARKSGRRSGGYDWWMLWRAPIILLVIMALWWFVLRPNAQGRDWVEPQLTFGLCGQKGAGRACVVDGDTLHIRRGANVRRIRITGYNAPELDGACEAEKSKALEARRALHGWLAQGDWEWDGADEPPFDQYGRELRALRRVNPKGETEELAAYMLGQGLAAESGWGTFPKDWCS